MKWAFLFVALAAVVPLAGWLRRNPRETPKIWILMGFLPFGVASFHLYMAVVSWAQWPGFVKGVELSILDMLAMALYLSLPRARHPLPFRLSIAFYCVAVLFSVLQAEVPEPALFYPWQLARMFLVYAVVARACTDDRVAPSLLKGMAIGLGMELCLAIWERFALGIIQTGGTFGHQNLLGLVSHFVVFPFFALLLAGQPGWWPAVVPLTGAIVAVLTTSRATVGLAAFGYAALFAISILHRWTSRKALVALVGAVAIAALTPLALSSFERRFEAELQSDYDERAAFEEAAAMILSDHPMGVGANNYVVVANVQGYNARAGVAWTSGAGTVHNVYRLVAAESGYLGLIAFVLLLLHPLMTAFLCGWRNRGDRRGYVLLGLGVALLTVYIHSFFEWIFITFQVQYMFAAAVGLVAGLAQQLGYWRRVPAPGSKFGGTVLLHGRENRAGSTS